MSPNRTGKKTSSQSRYPFQVLFHTALIIVPLFTFTGILLGLVYDNLWDHSSTKVETLSLSSAFSSEVLFVNYSATSLILVASWSSSVVLPLVGSLLTLSSYVIAADIRWLSERNLCALLPSRRQLGILIDLIDGKKMTLLTWFTGFWRRDHRRMPARWLLEMPAGIQLAALCLSVFIIAADTWLHVATKSHTLWYLDKVSTVTDAGPSYYYSRNLTEYCRDPAQPLCSVTLEPSSGHNVTVSTEGIKNLITDSILMDTRINASANGTFYLAPRAPTHKQQPSNVLAFQTFTAKTLGAVAQCSTNQSHCNIIQANEPNVSWRIVCPSGFSGNVTPEAAIRIGSWWNQTNSTSWFADTLAKHEPTKGQIQIGIAAFMNATNITRGPNLMFNTTYPGGSGSVFAALCNVTIHSARYSWTNSTIAVGVQDVVPDSQAGTVALAALLGRYFDSIHFDRAQRRALIARNSTLSDISETDLMLYLNPMAARVSLSLLGGVIDNQPAEALALANSAVVTIVEKAPLFTLVILNIWFAGFGLVLGLLVLYIVRDCATREEVFQIQELLTVNGLATAHAALDAAENKNSKISETGDMRVGVIKKNGTWQFRYINLDDGESESTKLLQDEESAVD